MTFQEIREVHIEDLTADIKRLNEFLEYTQTAKIDSDIKNEFSNRIIKEIDWLEQIREEEEEALSFIEMGIDNEIEELRIKSHENLDILEKIQEDGNEMFNKKESE